MFVFPFVGVPEEGYGWVVHLLAAKRSGVGKGRGCQSGEDTGQGEDTVRPKPPPKPKRRFLERKTKLASNS